MHFKITFMFFLTNLLRNIVLNNVNFLFMYKYKNLFFFFYTKSNPETSVPLLKRSVYLIVCFILLFL